MITRIKLELDNIQQLIIITDSPTSQYRNKGCAFLTKKFAELHQITVTWIFTESGHGKGPMDGVGAAIKNEIDRAVIAAESMPNIVVRCTNDLVPILNLVNVAMCQYDTSNQGFIAKS